MRASPFALTAFALIASTASAQEEPLLEGREEAPQVELVRTGNVKQCLGRETIEGWVALSDKRFLFDTRDGFYLNEVTGECYGATEPGANITFMTNGSMICRNDTVYINNEPSKRPYSCTLDDFQELKPVGATSPN